MGSLSRPLIDQSLGKQYRYEEIVMAIGILLLPPHPSSFLSFSLFYSRKHFTTYCLVSTWQILGKTRAGLGSSCLISRPLIIFHCRGSVTKVSADFLPQPPLIKVGRDFCHRPSCPSTISQIRIHIKHLLHPLAVTPDHINVPLSQDETLRLARIS